jgi:drug/metabolite transporter (DMT)-like permease
MPVFQQRLMRQTKEVENAAMLGLISSSIIATILLGGFVAIIGFSPPKSWSDLTWHMIGMTIFYAIGHLCIFQSLRFINPSLFGAIFTARVIVVVAAAVFFLDEAFNWLKLVGIVVIVVGIVIGTITRGHGAQEIIETAEAESKEPDEDGSKPNLPLGIALALTGTGFFGAANSIDADVVKTFSPPSYLLFRLVLPVLFVILVGRLFFGVKPRDIKEFMSSQQWRRPLVGMSVCLVISSATFMMAYEESKQLAFISGVHQLSLFATIGISATVNKDERRNFPLYLLAGIVCLSGVALLRWG